MTKEIIVKLDPNDLFIAPVEVSDNNSSYEASEDCLIDTGCNDPIVLSKSLLENFSGRVWSVEPAEGAGGSDPKATIVKLEKIGDESVSFVTVAIFDDEFERGKGLVGNDILKEISLEIRGDTENKEMVLNLSQLS